MANSKVKFQCSSCGNAFNLSEQASLFTVITSLKYKFVLCLLKKDGRIRSISVYNDIIKLK